MRRKALLMVLSQKLKDKELILLDKIEITKPKTKEMLKVIQDKKSILVALPKMDKNVILSARNIPKITTIQAKDLNCLDILNYKYLMLLKEGIKVIKETFL